MGRRDRQQRHNLFHANKWWGPEKKYRQLGSDGGLGSLGCSQEPPKWPPCSAIQGRESRQMRLTLGPRCQCCVGWDTMSGHGKMQDGQDAQAHIPGVQVPPVHTGVPPPRPQLFHLGIVLNWRGIRSTPMRSLLGNHVNLLAQNCATVYHILGKRVEFS